MRIACALALLALFGSLALAKDQEEELTPYSGPEIEQFLKVFKQTYKNKKQPEDDAVAVLDDLKKAHAYLASKQIDGKNAKEDAVLMKSIVHMIAAGLKARKRPLVTLECARALGKIGDKQGARSLLKWMDKTVLDAKSPNPQWVEYGFLALASIGGQDKNALDLVLKYSTGKHPDIGVAAQAMRAAYEWRELSGKNRKEFFNKINGYLGSLWSQKNGSDQKKRGNAERRYNTVKDEGLRALTYLSGVEKRFKNPVKSDRWWHDNKKRKWEKYVGVGFRKKAAQKPKDKAASKG